MFPKLKKRVHSSCQRNNDYNSNSNYTYCTVVTPLSDKKQFKKKNPEISFKMLFIYLME